jgi:hypothetical protein
MFRPGIRIDILPDDVLLEMFDFHMIMNLSLVGKMRVEVWQSLVHVCRRWRSLVLRSPRRLNLRLWCSPQTPARDTLDVWPALPLTVKGDMTFKSSGTGMGNVTAALQQRNRVYEVFLLGLAGWQLENVLAAMHVSFQELTELRLYSNGETMPVIPDSFLGGSAPSLRIFALDGIPFPGLPKLLLSAPRLVRLTLSNIPHSGYISPEAMIGLLSVLSGLRRLDLEFESPQSCPDWQTRRPPPSKRSILPALGEFSFKGVTEYLEELVTRVDTPRLKHMFITFFNQIDFDCPRFAQFINRTSTLVLRTLKTLNYDAHVEFDSSTASVKLRCRTESSFGNIQITISCREPDWQLSSIEQVCNSSLPPVSKVEDLYVGHRYGRLVWKNDAIEDTLWWQLLLPFTAVKNLYLSKDFAPGIAAALRKLDGGRITVMLPSLQNILVEGLEPSGPLQENIGQFVAARKLSDHPITISVWTKTST